MELSKINPEILLSINDNQTTDNSLPQNVEAERAVIGALLNNNEHINNISDFLHADHFFVPLHGKIFQAISKFYERGLVASPVTLKSYFETEVDFKSLGVSSLDYLLKLSANSASVMTLIPYAKDIYETSMKRKLIKVGEEIVADSFKNEIDYDSQRLLEKAESKLFSLASTGDSDSGFSTLRESVIESIKRIDKARKQGANISGVTTGFTDLDKILGGLQPSDLLILAARPSMGKTALAVNLALNAAEAFMKEKEIAAKKSVGIFSLEMSSEQLANRLIAIKTGIDGSKIRIGNISKQEFEVLLKQTTELSEIPIFIDDTPAITISALRTRARRLKRQHNLGLIVVDYLQLVRGSPGVEQSRIQEIGEISQGLKAIAKELDIPVIALSQLSRAVESRDDKRPQLSDLRESGNIEQDADVVMFIYRDEYYLSRKMPQETQGEKYLQWQQEMDKVRNITEILVSKQRNGPVGTVSVRFDNGTTRFTNLETSGSSRILPS